MIGRSEWKWFGNAAHFICGRCEAELDTEPDDDLATDEWCERVGDHAQRLGWWVPDDTGDLDEVAPTLCPACTPPVAP